MLQGDLDELRRQIRDLTDRVARVEERLAARQDVSRPQDAGARQAGPSTGDNKNDPASQGPETTALLPVLGGTTLVFAGAYLLRAIAESGVIPPKVAFTVATLYAVAWLLWAPRAHGGSRVATALYSLTAALILSPLLMEATVRFHTVVPWQTSVILLAFTLIGLAVSWHRNLLTVATISTLAGVGTAGALLIATHDVLPFAFAFLAIAAVIETCACIDHWLGERWVAAAADLSIVLATWLVTNPRGLPEGYAPIPFAALFGAQMSLLAIYLSSVTVRTLLRGRIVTTFETLQCAAVFSIVISGVIRLSPRGSLPAAAIEGFTLLCGAACYVISFKVLAGKHSQERNFYTYSTFAILLVLAGCRLTLNDGPTAMVWSLLALACIGAAGIRNGYTLEMHGGVYLLLALLLSGAVRHSGAFLLGTDFWPRAIPPALWLGALLAGASYLLAVRSSHALQGGWKPHSFRVITAAATVWLVMGLAAGTLTGAYHQFFAAAGGDSYCATLRTATVVGITLLVAWTGSRLNFPDLTRLVYPLMVLGGYRLLVDDLRQSLKGAMFLSLLLYGAALIALPRLRRARGNLCP